MYFTVGQRRYALALQRIPTLQLTSASLRSSSRATGCCLREKRRGRRGVNRRRPPLNRRRNTRGSRNDVADLSRSAVGWPASRTRVGTEEESGQTKKGGERESYGKSKFLTWNCSRRPLVLCWEMLNKMLKLFKTTTHSLKVLKVKLFKTTTHSSLGPVRKDKTLLLMISTSTSGTHLEPEL